MPFKEDGRLKPADPKEVADSKTHGKTFACSVCGYTEQRFKVEFSELPKCPKCKSGLMSESLNI
jgi:predicted Zn-ribbon and HTH transcriptional regulator